MNRDFKQWSPIKAQFSNRDATPTKFHMKQPLNPLAEVFVSRDDSIPAAFALENNKRRER